MSSHLQLYNDGHRGSDGATGHQGSHGSDGVGGHGGTGGRGHDGNRGTDSGYISAKISSEHANINIDFSMNGTSTNSERRGLHQMDMGDPQNYLTLSSRGGDGGDGGRGGRGGDGGRGTRGHDATRHSNGTNGGRGGDGGSGGRGGDGGDSGHGSNIDIYNAENDMDLLMILHQTVPCTSAGTPGRGGDGGNGGSGGAGGAGGSSYSWQETTTSTNSEGRTTYHTVTHTNPGGFSGSSGSHGHGGASGSPGHRGRDGTFTINLKMEMSGSVIKYPSPYDFSVESISYIDTIGYNVIEPDAHVLVMVSHKNVGGMPSPSKQDIYCYFSNNEWVECEVINRVPMKRWIEPNEHVKIPKDVLVHIRDFHQIIGKLPREPFTKIGTFENQALVERVNLHFSRVAKRKDNFTIEYPVLESMIRGLDCITFGDESPICYSIWNKSLLSIGRNASVVNIAPGPNRLLYTTLKIHEHTRGGTTHIDPHDYLFRNYHGETFKQPEIGLYSDFNLHPSELKFFSGTFQFTNPDIKPYTRVLLESALFLGHVKHMDVPQAIQSRPFEIQLSEGFNPSELDCDFLLVPNNQTEFQEATFWKTKFSALGKKCNIWNINLYKDFNLAHLKKDGKSLLEDFRGKTIVFLNNGVVRDEKLHYAATYIRQNELFKAAQYHGINCLVVGKEFDMESQLVPMIQQSQWPTNFVYYQSPGKFLKSLKSGYIDDGKGTFKSNPNNQDHCCKVKVDDKVVWVSLFPQTKTLSIYKYFSDRYPLASYYLNKYELSDYSHGPDEDSKPDEASFTLSLTHKDIVLKFTKPQKSKHASIPLKTLYNDLEALVNANLTNQNNQITNLVNIILDETNLTGTLEIRPTNNGSYKKRFFELDLKNRLIYRYYDDKKSAKGKRFMDIHRFALTYGNAHLLEDDHHDICFQIVTCNQVYHLRCKDVNQYNEWVGKLSPFSVEYKQVFNEIPYQVKESVLTNPKARGFHLDPKSPIAEEPLVGVIPVHERFFFTKPKEKDVVKHIKKLNRKLQSRYPNQRNVYVYDYNPQSVSGLAKKSLGEIHVHRSLDKTSPHYVVMQLPTNEDIHNEKVLNQPNSFYSLVKALPFLGKLSALDYYVNLNAQVNTKITQDGFEKREVSGNMPMLSNLGLIMYALVSDITDEQCHFRQSKWRDSLSVSTLKLKLNCLNQLKRFQFKSRSGVHTLLSGIICEIGYHLKNICKNLKKSVLDTLMFRRRGTDVTNATLDLWEDIIKVHVFGYELKSDKPVKTQDEFEKDIIETYENQSKPYWEEFAITNSPQYGITQQDQKSEKLKINQDAVIQAYRIPPFSGSLTDSASSFDYKYMSKSAYTAAAHPFIPTMVVEERHTFGADNAARKQFINNLQVQQLGCPVDQTENSLLEVLESINSNKPKDIIFVQYDSPSDLPFSDNLSSANNNNNITTPAETKLVIDQSTTTTIPLTTSEIGATAVSTDLSITNQSFTTESNLQQSNLTTISMDQSSIQIETTPTSNNTIVEQVQPIIQEKIDEPQQPIQDKIDESSSLTPQTQEENLN
ncbi:hypothetical protein DLAC_05177 [Tieghemostelium lacteum]|uniref:PH domain-containing protein n=1 Tax=Tieghemostelium lacteum TaxID=361077 RepID=A0A151ZIV9_TIELA|nr:hypothetical protein DLAC_05177 [Tieghemostelium lacteum]|eukprot:KYQ93784.1 hypothetical protein DLAC_05177 [Tieghemostelium lacteum]